VLKARDEAAALALAGDMEFGFGATIFNKFADLIARIIEEQQS
jgi:hypothetical protein